MEKSSHHIHMPNSNGLFLNNYSIINYSCGLPYNQKPQKIKERTFEILALRNMQNVLHVKNLSISWVQQGEEPIVAVHGLTFSLQKAKTLALIGASGSGKSITALSLMGLLPRNAFISGKIELEQAEGYLDLVRIKEEKWGQIRGKYIGMVFQEPMSALNPIMKCGKQLAESLRAHGDISRKQARYKALEWMAKVKLPRPERMWHRYPHELSGGQKQRLMIAMAMCHGPKLLIADEATTALDVTVQKEVLGLIRDLQQETGTALLFITHDLALARTLTDDFLVLERGKVAPAAAPIILEKPKIGLDIGYPQRELLKVENLSVRFPETYGFFGRPKTYFQALDGVSFQAYEGEALGIVGESGCGKTTLGRTLMGLQPRESGLIRFRDKVIQDGAKEQWKRLRSDIQIVFQDPYASLNQRVTIGDILMEPLEVHAIVPKAQRKAEVARLLDMVQLPQNAVWKYPYEFSGGQRQRICIARALSVRPRLLICDESVSALDPGTQEGILALLANVQREQSITYLFITHDLEIVRRFCQRAMVMRNGKIVEEGPTAMIMERPKDAYTRQLLEAIPGKYKFI